MPYPVPPSRLRPPRTAREVSRLRPLGLVEAAFGKSPGVVLAAGPGYGKTSLAAEMGGVYLALAEEAKDPAVFLWHLLYAYRDRAGLSEAARLLEGGAWPRALEALLEALEPLGPQLLVLDEAHRAESPGVLKALEGLCRLPSLRLLLLSRKAAPFAFLTVLTEQELAFDPEEACALAKALAPELPAFEVERAHSLVRGWPLGLRAVLLAMRRGLRPELALESGEGLLAYLAYGLPQDLLLRAARLALLGEVPEEEAEDLLPHAEDLLLERREGRLAFHPLVRSALKALLPGAEARELLAQAAEAALLQGEGVRAAEFLLEAGRFGHAADLLLKEGQAWLARGLTYTVLRLLAHLPEGVRRGRTGLFLLEAEALRQAGRYREAEAAYQRALEAGEGRAYLGLVRLFLDTVEPARARPYLQEALKRFPEEARPLLAENLLNEGRPEEASRLGLAGPRVLLRQGRPCEALALLREAKDPGLHRPPQNHREGSLLRALLESVAGDAEEGLRFAERGRFEAEVLGSPFGVSLAEARRGHALLALGRLEEAKAAYQTALALAEGGPARLQVEALGGLAALGSREAYGEMVRLARSAGDLWVEGFMTLAVALAWLRRGEAFPLPPLELLDPFLREVAEAYPFADGWEGLLLRYPFLSRPTLFAPPLPRLRRALWRLGQLAVAYHPGVRLEVRALGGFRVLVDGKPVRFRREKARLLLALLAARDWEKEDLLEALEVSPGEFRVLWWEVLNALEPGRPKGAPPYFLRARPYGLRLEVPELYLDLLDPKAPLDLPFADLDHPALEERRLAYLAEKRRLLRQGQDLRGWLALLRLDPLDEEAFTRLQTSPLAPEAERLRLEALRELGLG
jgi:LuxR family transcriptional regulator, maltose regulon positive regulatory protein